VLPTSRNSNFDNGKDFSSEFVELLNSYGVNPKPKMVKNL
jgi:hypothetical protein